jgi:hypothetical protein
LLAGIWHWPQLSIGVANIDASSPSVVSAVSAIELGLLSQAASSGSIDGASQVWHFDRGFCTFVSLSF